MKFVRNAMKKSKRQKGPSLYLSTSSRESSPYCPSAVSDWDADDEGFMSSREYLSRPLSVAIPSGPYCPRRPTLSEILTNLAPPPWTLAAFMAYLSQNHCLETLEFTMDASRYRKQYETLTDIPGEPVSPENEGCDFVRMLWQKLLDAYIAANGPREVNLPSSIRNHLLNLPNVDVPPHPSVLDPAVRIIYELMDESVLVPFLNSVVPLRGPESFSSPWTSSDDVQDGLSPYGRSLDSRTYSPVRPRKGREHSPPQGGLNMDSYSSSQSRYSQQSYLSASAHRGGRHSANAYHSSATSSSSDMHDATWTDDSGSSASPTISMLEPMTPPTTPPTSDAGFMGPSPGTSPKNARGEGSGWKKMSAKLGWKKSKSSQMNTSGGRYSSEPQPMDEDEEMS